MSDGNRQTVGEYRGRIRLSAPQAGHAAGGQAGYAIHIGRVGALAVALGVGVAAATGQGIGVARAERDSSSTNSSSNESSSNSSSNESSAKEPSSGGTSTGANSTDSPSSTTDTSSPSDASSEYAASNNSQESAQSESTSSQVSGPAPGVVISSSGGAHTSGSDDEIVPGPAAQPVVDDCADEEEVETKPVPPEAVESDPVNLQRDSGSTGTIIETIPLDFTPTGIAVTPDGSTIYVAAADYRNVANPAGVVVVITSTHNAA